MDQISDRLMVVKIQGESDRHSINTESTIYMPTTNHD